MKRCIERYAKPEDYEFGWGDSLDPLMTDEEYNGIQCSSGLAKKSGTNMAVCVWVTKIVQNGKTLSSPYDCDPNDNEDLCLLYYNSSSYITSPCRCALDG